MEQLSSEIPCEITDSDSTSSGPRGYTGDETSYGEEESGDCSSQDLPHQRETGDFEGESLSGKGEICSKTHP